MSDLISRSELINKIRGIVPGSQDVDFIVRLIKNQPTAYSVDEVVEELECDRCESCNLLEVCAESKYCGKCHEKIIEIVNQGGVSNDVCEWKFEETNGIAWHCDDKCTTYNQVYIKDLKIILEDFECKCPYCSKKIKVVE